MSSGWLAMWITPLKLWKRRSFWGKQPNRLENPVSFRASALPICGGLPHGEDKSSTAPVSLEFRGVFFSTASTIHSPWPGERRSGNQRCISGGFWQQSHIYRLFAPLPISPTYPRPLLLRRSHGCGGRSNPRDTTRHCACAPHAGAPSLTCANGGVTDGRSKAEVPSPRPYPGSLLKSL